EVEELGDLAQGGGNLEGAAARADGYSRAARGHHLAPRGSPVGDLPAGHRHLQHGDEVGALLEVALPRAGAVARVEGARPGRQLRDADEAEEVSCRVRLL